MSTTIKDAQESTDYLRLGIDFDGEIMVTLHHEIEYDGEVTGYLTRDDFLAAVAQECGVIIIDKSELPKVLAEWERELLAGDEPYKPSMTAAQARGEALALLAEAEYLDAHPPVDEGDVEALAGELRTASKEWMNHKQAASIARDLLASGRIEVKK